jgi:hypothetical protein
LFAFFPSVLAPVLDPVIDPVLAMNNNIIPRSVRCPCCDSPWDDHQVGCVVAERIHGFRGLDSVKTVCYTLLVYFMHMNQLLAVVQFHEQLLSVIEDLKMHHLLVGIETDIQTCILHDIENMIHTLVEIFKTKNLVDVMKRELSETNVSLRNAEHNLRVAKENSTKTPTNRYYRKNEVITYSIELFMQKKNDGKRSIILKELSQCVMKLRTLKAQLFVAFAQLRDYTMIEGVGSIPLTSCEVAATVNVYEALSVVSSSSSSSSSSSEEDIVPPAPAAVPAAPGGHGRDRRGCVAAVLVPPEQVPPRQVPLTITSAAPPAHGGRGGRGRGGRGRGGRGRGGRGRGGRGRGGRGRGGRGRGRQNAPRI